MVDRLTADDGRVDGRGVDGGGVDGGGVDGRGADGGGADVATDRPGRVIAAVLMADIVESTSLFARHGDQTMETVIKQYEADGRAIVEQAHGTIVKFLGDGLLAFFPTVTDAVSAAVKLHRSSARRARHEPVAIAQRIGITVGEMSFRGGDIRGLVVAEAARLCSAAEPHGILLSDLARRMARVPGLRAEPAGELALKGFPDPITVWTLRWRATFTAARVPDRLRPGNTVAFVGRDQAIGELTAVWDAAAAGTSGVAVVVGEPGIGKSRLAAEFAALVADRGGVVLAGRCPEFPGAAYTPLADMVADLLALDGPDRRWHDYVAEHPQTFGAVRPANAAPGEAIQSAAGGTPESIGRAAAGRHGADVGGRGASGDVGIEELAAGIVDLLVELTEDHPAVIVAEDVHWAAPDLLGVLRRVVANCGAARVVFVVTSRSGDDEPRFLRRLDGARRLELNGLAAADIETLVGERVAERVDAAEVGRIAALAGGNPLFALGLAEHAEVGSGRLPTSIDDVLTAQISRLAPATIGLLELAAVAGHRFEVDVLAGISALDDAATEAALGEAEEAGLIHDRSTSTSLAFEFHHALLGDVLRRRLSSLARRRAHAGIADRLTGSSHSDAIGRAARHAVEGGAALPAERALDLFAAAAAAARVVGAHGEAAMWTGHALDRLGAGAPAGARAPLLVKMARSTYLAGGDASAAIDEAMSLATSAGDPATAAAAALAVDSGTYTRFLGVEASTVERLRAALAAQPDQRSAASARLQANLASELTFVDPLNERFALSDTALTTARALDDPATIAHVLRHRLALFSGPHHVTQRLREAHELLELQRRLRGDATTHTSLLQLISHARLQSGDAAGGRQAMDEARALAATRTSTPAQRGSMALWEAGWALLDGDLVTAERSAKAAFRGALVPGGNSAATARQLLSIRWWQGRPDAALNNVRLGVTLAPSLCVHLAHWLLVTGHQDEAQEQWSAWDDVEAPSIMLIGGFGESLVAEAGLVCAALDTRERCEWYYELLAPFAEVLINPICPDRSTHVVLGELADRFRPAAAEEHFRAGIDHAQRLGAPLLAADASLRLARLQQARGNSAEATLLIGQVNEIAARHAALGLAHAADAVSAST